MNIVLSLLRFVYSNFELDVSHFWQILHVANNNDKATDLYVTDYTRNSNASTFVPEKLKKKYGDIPLFHVAVFGERDMTGVRLSCHSLPMFHGMGVVQTGWTVRQSLSCNIQRYLYRYYPGDGWDRNKHVPTKVTSDAADCGVGDKRLHRDEE